jgi:hypothetical protein
MDLFSGFWTLIVALIAFLGGCCFTLLAPPDFLDKSTAVHYALIGIIGSVFLALTLLEIRHCDPTWEFMALRRNVLLLILCLAWCFGAAGGFAVFYVIPRFTV